MKPLRRLLLPAPAAAPAAEVPPGGITAAVWTMFNADMLADRPERMA